MNAWYKMEIFCRWLIKIKSNLHRITNRGVLLDLSLDNNELTVRAYGNSNVRSTRVVQPKTLEYVFDRLPLGFCQGTRVCVFSS